MPMRSNSFTRLDLFRGLGQGVLDTGFGVFIILIAIRFLNAPDYYKAALSGGGSIGLILTPVLFVLFSKNHLPEAHRCAFYLLGSSVFILLASFCSTIFLFTVFLVFAQVSLSQVPNLMIRIYSEVYESGERGKKISFNLISSTLGGLLSSFIFGTYLDGDHADFRVVLWGMSTAAMFSCFFVWRMKRQIPTDKKEFSQSFVPNSLLDPLRDSLFVRILIAWMILGFGAIMTFPLRIEYLSREDQLNLSNQEIAVVTVMIFFGAKVLSMFLWGKLFDQMHFMKFRILLNIQMIIAILVYFNSSSFIGVVIGSALAGSVMGGANIAWNLWITKLAPKGKEGNYMSVHMTLTGVRGVTAPFLGYLLESQVGFQGVSYISVGMIFLATVLFATTIKSPRFLSKNNFEELQS